MVKAYWADFKRYLPLLWSLTSRDIKLKYRRSVLGLAWSILNPLLIMIVLTQVFGMLLKITVDNFPVYYIVGSSLFNFFSEATTGSMSSVLSSAPLIKKVYIPKYIFPLEKCMFSLVNLLFSMIAVVIVMAFYIIIGDLQPSWTILLFFLPIFYCFLFAVGMSLILSALTVFFRDLLHLWGVVMTVWLYLTPIIYPLEVIQDSWVMTVVQFNPLYYYVQYFRAVMMYGQVPGLLFNLGCLAMGLATIAIGVLIFKKTQDKFILHI